MVVQQQGIITALIHLPLFYKPEEQGKRQLIEEEKFIVTAEEISKEFGGGLLHLYQETPPKGFWWDRDIVQRDDIALLEVDIPDTAVGEPQMATILCEGCPVTSFSTGCHLYQACEAYRNLGDNGPKNIRGVDCSGLSSF